MRGVQALFLTLGAAVGVFYPFIAVILIRRGFDVVAVGVVTAVSAACFTFAVPVWGHLADVKLGRPRALQIAAAASSAALLLTLGPVPALVVAGCYVAFAAFESAFAPLSDAIAVNAVHDPRRDYARIRLLASLAFAVATIAAGFLYDRTGYGPAPLLFTLLAAAAIASAAVTPDVERADLRALAAPEPAEATEPAGGRDRRPGRRLPTWRLGSVGVALGLAPRLPAVLLAIGLIQVGIIGGFTFLAVRLQELGANPSAIALSSGISAAAEIPAFLVAGAVARRVGIRGLFAGSALLYSACFVSWMVIDVPALLIATRVLTGVSFAGISVAAVLTVAALLPDRLQATGQALYQTTAFGLAAIVANIAGGVVYGAAGPAAVFGLAAAAGLAAVVVGWVVLPTRAAQGARPATGTTAVPH